MQGAQGLMLPILPCCSQISFDHRRPPHLLHALPVNRRLKALSPFQSSPRQKEPLRRADDCQAAVFDREKIRPLPIQIDKPLPSFPKTPLYKNCQAYSPSCRFEPALSYRMSYTLRSFKFSGFPDSTFTRYSPGFISK